MVPCLGAREFPAKIPMALIDLEAVCKSAVSVLSPRLEESAVTSSRVCGEIKREMETRWLIGRQTEEKENEK